MVRATDRAGNTGQSEIRLNVVPPLDLVVSAPSDTVSIGEKIKLSVNITALNPVAQIDLIVDNQVVSSDQTPPFNLTLDTRDVPPGQHIVTVRAIDDQGQLARASLPMNFQTQDTDYNWLRVLLIVGLMITVVAAGFAIGRTIQVMRRSYQRTCRVELRNLGNVPTRYELLADDPANVLKFRLLINGVAMVQEPLEKPIARSITPAAPPPQVVEQKPAAPPKQPNQLREQGRVLVDLAYTLGTIIPGSVGQRFTQWAAAARNVDYTAQRVEYAGQQAQSLGGASQSASTASSSEQREYRNHQHRRGQLCRSRAAARRRAYSGHHTGRVVYALFAARRCAGAQSGDQSGASQSDAALHLSGQLTRDRAGAAHAVDRNRATASRRSAADQILSAVLHRRRGDDWGAGGDYAAAGQYRRVRIGTKQWHLINSKLLIRMAACRFMISIRPRARPISGVIRRMTSSSPARRWRAFLAMIDHRDKPYQIMILDQDGRVSLDGQALKAQSRL